MEQRILDLKNLFDNGINLDLFQRLVLHSTDGNSESTSAYANNQEVSAWVTMYNKPFVTLGVNNEQVELFLDYMVANHSRFFTKSAPRYAVNKYFNNDEKAEGNFQFELILLLSFAIL